MHSSGTAAVLRPAAYLRAIPARPGAADLQREALRHFAAQLGLPVPAYFLDDGLPPAAGLPPQPGFEALVRSVLDGTHRMLLIPGPWVLAAGEGRVQVAMRLLTAAGCTRILALPGQRPARPRP
ncbi:recombinase family protein [Kitasatospora sp. NPDC006697]|uniref:recombinase family protein n=1 Tax=Kitasatospora sp. NPDC006697 TaxID=3364020 RepID=UPI0036820662